MAAWHRTWKADYGLRAAGVVLCALAYAAIARLCALHPPVPPATAGIAAYALAASGFLCASVGGALTTHGSHVFDEIEVSPRWRHGAGAAPTRDEDRHPIAPAQSGARIESVMQRSAGPRAASIDSSTAR